MFYENELLFLCDTLKKNHLRAVCVTPNDFIGVILNNDFKSVPGSHLPREMTVRSFFEKLEERTMYKVKDSFKRCYIYLLLPSPAKKPLFFIGPYLQSEITPHELLEIGEKNKISPKDQRNLEKYFQGLPVISDSNPLFVMLETFCERIWDTPAFSIIDNDRDRIISDLALKNTQPSDSFDDTLVNMKAMEARYNFENEIIQAVSLGQIHKEKHLLSAFSDQFLEKRTSDQLRNSKNYCIIMNTLLRKAAESGGVHPIHLDRISSFFASRIEQLPSVSETSELMREMFGSYCRLVRKHSMKDFSLIVQKTLLLIDSEISSNISLSLLADKQNISPGYLSTVFKKETGKTVSEYIREKRVAHAEHLLSTTRLQIQTVALHCGIMDVQYFSKIFKKQTGMTPKEYRESIKQNKTIFTEAKI